MKIKVMIVDDHTVIRSGLSMLINSQEDMEVIGAAENGREAYEQALALNPDVIVMDLNMPEENGLSATKRIKDKLPDIEILILTMHDDKEYLFEVLKAGASGYILKSAKDSDLMTAIRTVRSGAAYLYPSATKVIISDYLTRSQSGEENYSLSGLTEREAEILPYIAQGYSYKEISEKLYLSVKTVEAYKAKIMEKLNLQTRPELIKYAMKNGFLTID